MSKKLRLAFFLLAGLSVPLFASAATSNIGFEGLNKLILSLSNGVIRSIGYMLFTLAVVAFFWGIIQFIWSARQGAEGKGISNGKTFMMWGLIGLFVMFSVWGIIKFAQGVFGIQGENTIIVPTLDFKPGSGTSGDPASGSVKCDPPNELIGGVCSCDAQCRRMKNEQRSGTSQSPSPSGTTIRTGGASSPASSGDYRNGADVQSDNASTAGNVEESNYAASSGLPVCGTAAANRSSGACSPSDGQRCNKGDGMFCNDDATARNGSDVQSDSFYYSQDNTNDNYDFQHRKSTKCKHI